MNDYLTGLHADMSNAEYHSQIHIGSSGFKLLERSPLHFWHSSPLNADREPREPSIYMTIGTAWHTGIWEPHLFESSYAAKPDISANSTVYALLQEALADMKAFKARYVAMPEGLTKTSKEGKALLAELDARGQVGVEPDKMAQVLELAPPLIGKTLLSADSLSHVRSMVDAARNMPETQVIFSLPGGMSEHSIFWIDAITGAPCRIRPDYMVPPCDMFPSGLIIDGKTTDDASDKGFGKTAWNAEMYLQAAFYSDGFQQHFKTEEPPVFVWLAQERDAPFAGKYHSAPADFVQYGRKIYRRLLPIFAECLRTGVWPGYPGGVHSLSLPVYAAKEIDAMVAS